MEWQPIETAPKGTPILLAIFEDEGDCDESYYVIEVGWWEEPCEIFNETNGFWSSPSTGCGNSDDVKYWMPLPPHPPKKKGNP